MNLTVAFSRKETDCYFLVTVTTLSKQFLRSKEKFYNIQRIRFTMNIYYSGLN